MLWGSTQQMLHMVWQQLCGQAQMVEELWGLAQQRLHTVWYRVAQGGTEWHKVAQSGTECGSAQR